MLAFHTPAVPVTRPVRLRAATYRRRQLVAGLLLAATAFVLVTLAAHSLRDGEGAFAARPVAEVQVIVEPGDTVWSIAEALAGGEDVRPVVDAIVEANDGATLVVGQRLAVTVP